MDLSFSRLIALRLIRVAYALSLVGLMLCGAVLAGEAVQTMRSAMTESIGMLVGAVLIVVGGGIGARIACELVVVVFRLAEYVEELAEQTAAIATNTAMGVVTAPTDRR